MNYEIIPAILVETLDEFNERVEIAEDFAETIQWDVMDGRFVEPETFNDAEALEQVDTTLNIEAHLMVENPEEIIEPLAKAGIDRVIVHAESTDNLPALIARMKKFDYEIGVAISPETEVDEISDVIDDLDVVLVMTVAPGASGQSFMADQLEKVKELRASHPNLNISVDGGINLNTIKQAKEAGANLFGVNSAIFESPDPANAFQLLQAAIKT